LKVGEKKSVSEICWMPSIEVRSALWGGFSYALGVRHIGASIAQLLVDNFPTMSNL